MQFAFLNSNKYAAINALKATIAVAIAYTLGLLLGNFFNIEQMYLWMTITVVVVMSTQPNLGGALDKALMRFFGDGHWSISGFSYYSFSSKSYFTSSVNSTIYFFSCLFCRSF